MCMLRLFRRGFVRPERLPPALRLCGAREAVAGRLPDGFTGQDPRVRWGAYNGGLRAMQGTHGRQRAARQPIGPGDAGRFAANDHREFADAGPKHHLKRPSSGAQEVVKRRNASPLVRDALAALSAAARRCLDASSAEPEWTRDRASPRSLTPSLRPISKGPPVGGAETMFDRWRAFVAFGCACNRAGLPVRRLHHHFSGTNRPAAASITAPSENSVSSSNGRLMS
jgi:hypothetical protein